MKKCTKLRKFNINDDVLIKLTKEGKKLYEKHYRTFLPVQYPIPELPVEDENGYSKWQLWYVMEIFGQYMGSNINLPFETDILIDEIWLKNN
jgi:hypothetical protein